MSDLDGSSIFANSDPTGCPITECVLASPAGCSTFPVESYDNTVGLRGHLLSLPGIIWFDSATGLNVKLNEPQGYSHEICLACKVNGLTPAQG